MTDKFNPKRFEGIQKKFGGFPEGISPLTDNFRMRSRNSLNQNERPAVTQTEVLSERENWGIEQEKAQEFLGLINAIQGKAPRRLTEEDMQLVDGKSFRGTSLFLTLLSLYSNSTIQSIKDFSVYNPDNRKIQIKAFLAAPNKLVAGGYANKYIEQDSSNLVESFKKTEGAILERFCRDNGLDMDNIPPILLQPILLAFDQEPYRNDFEHKGFEGTLYSARPNESTLKLICKLLETTPDELKQQFPLITAMFG